MTFQIQASSILRQENSSKQLIAVDFCSLASFYFLGISLLLLWVQIFILNDLKKYSAFLGGFDLDFCLTIVFSGYLFCHIAGHGNLYSLVFIHVTLSTQFPSNLS